MRKQITIVCSTVYSVWAVQQSTVQYNMPLINLIFQFKRFSPNVSLPSWPSIGTLPLAPGSFYVENRETVSFISACVCSIQVSAVCWVRSGAEAQKVWDICVAFCGPEICIRGMKREWPTTGSRTVSLMFHAAYTYFVSRNVKKWSQKMSRRFCASAPRLLSAV